MYLTLLPDAPGLVFQSGAARAGQRDGRGDRASIVRRLGVEEVDVAVETVALRRGVETRWGAP